MWKTKPNMTRTTSTSRTSSPITTGELNRIGVLFGAIGGIDGVLGSINVGRGVGDPMGGGAEGVPGDMYGIGVCP